MPCSVNPNPDGVYLYLSSDDSKQYFPNNKTDDFTVKLPENYKLPGCWEVALTEIHYPEVTPEGHVLSVLSDICEESVSGGGKAPVLRKIYKVSEVWNQLYYVPVRSKEIDSIRIFIKESQGRGVSFANGTLHCALHIRKSDG